MESQEDGIRGPVDVQQKDSGCIWLRWRSMSEVWKVSLGIRKFGRWNIGSDDGLRISVLSYIFDLALSLEGNRTLNYQQTVQFISKHDWFRPLCRLFTTELVRLHTVRAIVVYIPLSDLKQMSLPYWWLRTYLVLWNCRNIPYGSAVRSCLYSEHLLQSPIICATLCNYKKNACCSGFQDI